MTTSDRLKSTLAVIFAAIYLACSVVALVCRIAQDVSPRKSDPVAEARAIESYLNWRKSSSSLNDPFNRSPFDRSYTISPKTKEDLAGSRAAVEAFMNDTRANDLSAAYQRTSASFRERMGRDEFEALICDHPELKEPSRWTGWVNIKLPNGSASQMFGADKTATTKLNFTATNTGGRWEIDGLEITAKK